MGAIPESMKNPQAAGEEVAAALLWRRPCPERILASKGVLVSFNAVVASARHNVPYRLVGDDAQHRDKVMTQAEVCV